ncbi:MAG: holo-ACP synthase [Bacilli bacterium]|jgi:holo-[acyl-carrier protein] synthase
MALGIDIVDMNRIRNAERLAKYVLSDAEYEIFLSRSDRLEFLAGRFAAKEAFLKARHTGIGSISFKRISIIYNKDNGAPELHFEDKIYDVSISHDGKYAVAVVQI